MASFTLVWSLMMTNRKYGFLYLPLISVLSLLLDLNLGICILVFLSTLVMTVL